MTMHPCAPAELTSYLTPWGLRVTVNKALLNRFKAACVEAHRKSKWKPRRIDSYNCRTIRGSMAYSRHAYGAAWDFFDKPYPEPVDVWGPTNSPSLGFRNIFESHGFTAGADWTSRPDFPHIEFSTNDPQPYPKPKPQFRLHAVRAKNVVVSGYKRARARARMLRKRGWKVEVQRREADKE